MCGGGMVPKPVEILLTPLIVAYQIKSKIKDKYIAHKQKKLDKKNQKEEEANQENQD
jgi:hypothetical protein